jgi:hypothetical protein
MTHFDISFGPACAVDRLTGGAGFVAQRRKTDSSAALRNDKQKTERQG